MRDASELECIGLGIIEEVHYFPEKPYTLTELRQPFTELQQCGWECSRNYFYSLKAE